mgnify:CR=1 FL=1
MSRKPNYSFERQERERADAKKAAEKAAAKAEKKAAAAARKEAGEVLETIAEYLPQWRADTANKEALSEVRRAFQV